VKMTFVLGLTGGIGSGKSTVSSFFKDQGFPVVDADLVSRQVVEPHSEGLNKIVETFGESILTEDSELDRKKLGQLIFSNDKKREELNQILHPIIQQEVLNQKQSFVEENHPLVVMDIPLLYETNYEDKVDAVMVVYVNRKTQLSRLMERDQFTAEEAGDRINSQMDLEKKREKADIVIYNNFSLENTENQLITWLTENGYIRK